MHSNEDLNDEQVFTMALQAETTTAQPFFSLIVTMSMHNPYNKFVEHGFEIADKQYSEEYLNYLIDCHYTDAQIERYINALKESIERGYERSMTQDQRYQHGGLDPDMSR